MALKQTSNVVCGGMTFINFGKVLPHGENCTRSHLHMWIYVCCRVMSRYQMLWAVK